MSAQTRNNPEKGCVEVTLFTQGDAPIYYTLDGSEPTDKSTRYTAPIEIRTGCTLQAIALRDNIEVRPYTRLFTANKALAHPIVLNTQPRDNYLYGAPKRSSTASRATSPTRTATGPAGSATRWS